MPYIALFYCHVRPAGVVATVAFQVRAPMHLLAVASRAAFGTRPPCSLYLLAPTCCLCVRVWRACSCF